MRASVPKTFAKAFARLRSAESWETAALSIDRAIDEASIRRSRLRLFCRAGQLEAPAKCRVAFRLRLELTFLKVQRGKPPRVGALERDGDCRIQNRGRHDSCFREGYAPRRATTDSTGAAPARGLRRGGREPTRLSRLLLRAAPVRAPIQSGSGPSRRNRRIRTARTAQRLRSRIRAPGPHRGASGGAWRRMRARASRCTRDPAAARARRPVRCERPRRRSSPSSHSVCAYHACAKTPRSDPRAERCGCRSSYAARAASKW